MSTEAIHGGSHETVEIMRALDISLDGLTAVDIKFRADHIAVIHCMYEKEIPADKAKKLIVVLRELHVTSVESPKLSVGV